MKRSCKNIDITDPQTIEPWVYECILRHRDRRDFKKLVCSIGQMSKADYRKAIRAHDKWAFKAPAENIAKEAAKWVKEKHLRLEPVKYRIQADSSSGKERLIGRESAMQQVLDHIAVGAAEPIFKRRIVPHQVSSIKERGQVYGTRIIQKWAAKDYKTMKWAKLHHVKYFPQSKYIVKIDIQKCYPSMRLNVFLDLFRRDCANEDLLWLWEQLLLTHQTDDYKGFMIGALPSQWAAQYMLSFVYRFAMGLHKVRRGKSSKLVKHMLLYMDDGFMAGSSRKDLKIAVQKIVSYTYDTLGLTIKPEWFINTWQETPADMMGYVVHQDSAVTVRPRVFLRARRMALHFLRTARMTIGQARRLCSYKGFFRPSKKRKARLNLRTRKVDRKLKLPAVFKAAAKVVSIYERRKNHERNLLRGTGKACVYAAA